MVSGPGVLREAELQREARRSLAEAGDVQALPRAVLRFHRKVDEVLAASIAGHSVAVACKRGCGYCCHLQVQVLPPESFALAAWLRARLDAKRLSGVMARLRENARRTRELGDEGRKHANIPCALLGPDNACTAYEARPAQCRRYHSTNLDPCKAFHATHDEAIESAMHEAVAHNADVIITQGRHAVRAMELDDASVDMNFALLEALDNPKAWRRWRDGKKAFVPR